MSQVTMSFSGSYGTEWCSGNTLDKGNRDTYRNVRILSTRLVARDDFTVPLTGDFP